jgi:hypothetical protein
VLRISISLLSIPPLPFVLIVKNYTASRRPGWLVAGVNYPWKGVLPSIFITLDISVSYTNYGRLLSKLPGIFYPTSHICDSMDHASTKMGPIDVSPYKAIGYQDMNFLFCVT